MAAAGAMNSDSGDLRPMAGLKVWSNIATPKAESQAGFVDKPAERDFPSSILVKPGRTILHNPFEGCAGAPQGVSSKVEAHFHESSTSTGGLQHAVGGRRRCPASRRRRRRRRFSRLFRWLFAWWQYRFGRSRRLQEAAFSNGFPRRLFQRLQGRLRIRPFLLRLRLPLPMVTGLDTATHLTTAIPITTITLRITPTATVPIRPTNRRRM